MEKKKLLFIIGVALIVILGIIAILLGKDKKPKEKEDNLNSNVLKDTTVEKLKITNQSVITTDGKSVYFASVTNESNEAYHLGKLYILVTLDGEVLKVTAKTNTDFAANETLPLNITFDLDISKATKVEFAVGE